MMLAHRTVLVTGADGFIGSHLVERLAAEGANVVALAQYNSFGSWGWLDTIPDSSSVRVVMGDVRDPHVCSELTRGIEIVFHLAALIAIPYSYSAPDSYVDTNIKGTLNMCQSALASGVGKFIQMSTSEVYGTARYVPIDEAHPLTPQSPYSASKIAADALASSFFYAFGLPVVIARPFNTYGPRQSARAVIPTIISQIAAGMKTISLGDLTPTRDFTFVRDTCDGLIRIACAEQTAGETFNIGSNQEISIGDLVRLIACLMSADTQIAADAERVRPSGSEVRRLWCDNSKLANATGFRPATSLEEGLKQTIEWFRDPVNLRRYRPDVYNV